MAVSTQVEFDLSAAPPCPVCHAGVSGISVEPGLAHHTAMGTYIQMPGDAEVPAHIRRDAERISPVKGLSRTTLQPCGHQLATDTMSMLARDGKVFQIDGTEWAV